MREYKFRGKSIYSDKWAYGFYLEQDVYNLGSKNTKKDLLGESTSLIVEDTKRASAMPVQKETVGQYTGLHDKNGKEVYEGDIVKSFFVDTDEAGNEIYKYYIMEVKYDEILCSYKIDKFMNLEVIGNIYENKELLNETD